jgi:hypothetical protein
MQRAVGVFRQLSRAPEPFYWVLRNPILIYFIITTKVLVGRPSQFTVIFLDWVKVAGLHAAAASQIKLGRKMRMVTCSTTRLRTPVDRAPHQSHDASSIKSTMVL